MDNELSEIIAQLGKFDKVTIETSYPLIEDAQIYAARIGCELVDVWMKPVNFPPECIVTFVYDRGEIVFSAFTVPLAAIAKLCNPTLAPNYTEQKDYPYSSFTIDETVFRLAHISIK